MLPHQIGGIQSRSRHLRTPSLEAPTSEAMSSFEDQSSTTSRKHVMDMQESVGQLVLKRKANLSTDPQGQIVQNTRMARNEKEDAFRADFVDRVRQARELYFTQEEMACKLGMEQDHYKHFESLKRRSLLSHHLIPIFCDLCNVSINWLFTGQGERALRPIPYQNSRIIKTTAPVRKRRVA